MLVAFGLVVALLSISTMEPEEARGQTNQNFPFTTVNGSQNDQTGYAQQAVGITGYNPYTGKQDELALFDTEGDGMGTNTHGLVGFCGTGPSCATPVSNSMSNPLFNEILSGSHIAGVDANGMLNTSTEFYTFTTLKQNAVSYSVTNTAGFSSVTITLGAVTATGGDTLTSTSISEDDGSGAYLWTSIPCYNNLGGTTNLGQLTTPTSYTTGGVAWVCSVAPHQAVQVTIAVTGTGTLSLPVQFAFGQSNPGINSASASYTNGQIQNASTGAAEPIVDSVPTAVPTFTNATCDSLNHSTGIAGSGQGQCGPTAPIICTQQQSVSFSSNNSVVNLSTAKNIYVCGYSLTVAAAPGTTGPYSMSIYAGGTNGTSCYASGETLLSGPQGVGVYDMPSGPSPALIVPSGKSLCLVLAANTTVNGYVEYAQF